MTSTEKAETSNSTQEKKEKDKQECVICLEEEAEMLAQPCNHRIVCVKCSEKLALDAEKSKSFTCPICRAGVTSMKSPNLVIETADEAYDRYIKMNAENNGLRTRLKDAPEGEKTPFQERLDKNLTEMSAIARAFLESGERAFKAHFKSHPSVRNSADFRRVATRFTQIVASYNQSGLLSTDEFMWVRLQINNLHVVDKRLHADDIMRSAIAASKTDFKGALSNQKSNKKK